MDAYIFIIEYKDTTKFKSVLKKNTLTLKFVQCDVLVFYLCNNIFNNTIFHQLQKVVL